MLLCVQFSRHGIYSYELFLLPDIFSESFMTLLATSLHLYVQCCMLICQKSKAKISQSVIYCNVCTCTCMVKNKYETK